MDRLKQNWKNKPYKGWRILAILLVVTLCIVRFVIWTHITDTNTRSASTKFNALIQDDTATLANQFEVYADTLYSERAFLLTNPAISQQDWITFVDAQDVKQRYPGVNGISYISVIPSSQAAQLTTKLNTNRLSTKQAPFTIYPPSHDGSMAVVTFVAPSNIAQHAIGYDLFTDPTRKQALDNARDTGAVQATTPLSLISDANQLPTSVLFVMPVYQSGAQLTSVTARQSALQGYVLLSLYTRPLLDTIFGTTANDGITVSVTTNHQTLYQRGSSATKHTLYKTITMNVSGQSWQLDLRAPDTFGLTRAALMAPLYVIVSIVPLFIIIVILFYCLRRLRILHELLPRDLTH